MANEWSGPEWQRALRAAIEARARMSTASSRAAIAATMDAQRVAALGNVRAAAAIQRAAQTSQVRAIRDDIRRGSVLAVQEQARAAAAGWRTDQLAATIAGFQQVLANERAVDVLRDLTAHPAAADAALGGLAQEHLTELEVMSDDVHVEAATADFEDHIQTNGALVDAIEAATDDLMQRAPFLGRDRGRKIIVVLCWVIWSGVLFSLSFVPGAAAVPGMLGVGGFQAGGRAGGKAFDRVWRNESTKVEEQDDSDDSDGDGSTHPG